MRILKLLLFACLMALGLSLAGLIQRFSPPTEPSVQNVSTPALFLAQPALAQQLGKSFLEEEAGISCYVNVGQAIKLDKMKQFFAVLEDETSEYLIGTVGFSDFSEDWWPRAWVHKDGWIVVYYPKGEPTSKLFYWRKYWEGKTTTTLREVLLWLCSASGLKIDMDFVKENLKHYNFQYPEAQKLFVVLDTGTSDSFSYTIPSNVTILEGSYSHYAGPWDRSTVSVDGVAISSGINGAYIGKLKDTFLRSGETHEVTISAVGGTHGIALFFLYK